MVTRKSILSQTFFTSIYIRLCQQLQLCVKNFEYLFGEENVGFSISRGKTSTRKNFVTSPRPKFQIRHFFLTKFLTVLEQRFFIIKNSLFEKKVFYMKTFAMENCDRNPSFCGNKKIEGKALCRVMKFRHPFKIFVTFLRHFFP